MPNIFPSRKNHKLPYLEIKKVFRSMLWVTDVPNSYKGMVTIA